MDEDYVPTPKRKSSCSLSRPPSVSLQIPCTSKSHSFCFVCKKPRPKLIVVSSQARFSIFPQNEIIIPAGSHCCPGHMYQDNFTSEAVSQNHHLIRVKIQSRHTSAKKYQLWIQYDSNQIVAWYCKCKAGARVVGACVHIASVLWYLGYARHNSDRRYGARKEGIFILLSLDQFWNIHLRYGITAGKSILID